MTSQSIAQLAEPIKSHDFATITLEYNRQLRRSMIKIAIFSLVIVAMTTLLLSYYSQKDFIQDLTKHKPFRDGAIAITTFNKDAVDWQKMEHLRNVFEGYAKLTDGVLRTLSMAIDAVEKGNAQSDKNRAIANLVERQYFFPYNTISGTGSLSIIQFSQQFVDEYGNVTSNTGAKRVKLTVSLSKPSPDSQYGFSVTQTLHSAYVDREKTNSTNLSSIFAAINKDEFASLLRFAKDNLSENNEEARKFSQELVFLQQEKEKIVSNSLTKLSTTEEIFYLSIFNKVLGAVALFSIIAVLLRQIATELRFTNAISSSYFAFLYSEVGAQTDNRLGAVAKIMDNLQREPKGGEGDAAHLNQLIKVISDLLAKTGGTK
ncbi:MAG: hypothetical protein H7Y60_13220 [Rhodospirillaceae bacterium]|nr:hypothetical protein [Rhodospirillales bacterium]